MNNNSIKWLVAGLAGAMLSLVLIGGGAFFLIRVAMEEFENYDSYESEEIEPSYGPDAWKEREVRYNEKQAKKQADLGASGLTSRYTMLPLNDDTRERLYEDQDFALVEARLTAQFEAADTPLRKHRYGGHIRYLGNLYYNEDPAMRWATLNAWVENSPKTHLPLLVRGSFAIQYAWYFRGTTMANEVTDEGWEGFRHYLNQAHEDLDLAYTMNPLDAEAPAAMITVSSALGLGEDAMESYYQKTLAINPLHRSARMSKLNFAQPKWGGSWRKIEDIIADCEANYEAFPMLAKVKRYGEYYMESRGKAYEDTWNSEETKQMMFACYRDQAAMSPDDLHVQAELASFAADLLQFKEASDAMHIIGDQFPEGCRYSNLPNYHKWRAIAYAEHAQYPAVVGIPQERQLMEEALALTPEGSTVTGAYLGYLARLRDDAKTKAFYSDLQDAYLMTGAWGDPIDYTVMEAMAKASRSDDFGIYDTEQGSRLLEEALALAPDNACVHHFAAENHITNKDYDEARIHLEKARALDPDYLPSLHIMGWLSFHQKRWDEGIEYANQFLATEPSAYLTEFADDAREIIELCEEKKAG
ncbi:MAG: DUF4034 domain-containing protein [Candidatus Hydrogenedentes bacterium]|nr:DUF4034 domain-containing protein [Candidatus Hydrogenedentota bacterium]